MTDQKTALFCAEGSINIGLGHIMRCAALAEGFQQKNWRCFFWVGEESAVVAQRLKVIRWPIIDTPKDDSTRILERFADGIDLLVVDDYRLGADFEGHLRGWARKILVLDDLADRPHQSDFILDSAMRSGENPYRDLAPPNCKFLLGPEFALLRHEFRRVRPEARWRRQGNPSGPPRLLVSFGGNDPENLSEKAVLELQDLNVELVCVVGNHAPALHSLRKLIDKIPNAVLDVAPKSMAEVMMRSDLAIGAGGSSSWERCALGLPAVTISIAENQRKINEGLASVGAVRYLGSLSKISDGAIRSAVSELLSDRPALTEMSQSAFSLCDAKGVERVINAVSR